MKNILFSLIFVLLAGSLWAQQQTNVLPQMEHRMHNDPLIQQNANPDQDPMFSGGMDFLQQNMQITDTIIKFDSVYIVRNGGKELREFFTYNKKGELTNYLFQEKVNGEWINDYISTNTYDHLGNNSVRLAQYWTDGILATMGMHTYTYDNNGNKLSSLWQYWKDNEWEDYTYFTYTNDENGNRLSELREDWEDGEWIKLYYYIYTYYPNGKLLTSARPTWKNNEWENHYLSTFTYNENGDFLTKLLQSWGGNIWRNKSLYTYSYDNNENLLNELYQEWENDECLNVWQETFTFNQNSNILTFSSQEWENDEWLNTILHTYSYDTHWDWVTKLEKIEENNVLINKKLVTRTYDKIGMDSTWQYQNWENNTWINSTLWTYKYNDKGDVLYKSIKQWKDDLWEDIQKQDVEFFPGKIVSRSYSHISGSWTGGYSYTSPQIIFEGKILKIGVTGYCLDIYYSDISGIDDPQPNPESSPIRCYPNPVIDQINIEIDPAWQAKNYHLELFSHTGQKVKSFEISSKIGSSIVPIRVADVPPGLYLLRINAKKQIFSQKIIISK